MRSIEEPSMANLKLFFSNIWNIYLLKNTIWKVNQGWVGTGNSRDETRQDRQKILKTFRDETRQDTETKIWIQEKARQQRCISRQVKIFKCSEIWFQDKSRHSNFWKPRDKTGQDSISCLVSAGKSGQDWILRSKWTIFRAKIIIICDFWPIYDAILWFWLKKLPFSNSTFLLDGSRLLFAGTRQDKTLKRDKKCIQDKARQ